MKPDGTTDYKSASVTRHRWAVDEDTPVFTKDRNYIQRFVDVGE